MSKCAAFMSMFIKWWIVGNEQHKILKLLQRISWITLSYFIWFKRQYHELGWAILFYAKENIPNKALDENSFPDDDEL